MANYMRKAHRGSCEAMLDLYSANKSTVYGLCCALLQDEKTAADATVKIFEKAFEALLAGKLACETDFSEFAMQKTISICKKFSLNSNSRARSDGRMSSSAIILDIYATELSDDVCRAVLENLPLYHRFVYVMAAVCCYTAPQIAQLLSTTPRSIQEILSAEEINIQRILSTDGSSVDSRNGCDLDCFHYDLIDSVLSYKVPCETDAAVQAVAKKLCLPVRQKRKKKQILAVTCASGLGILAIALVLTLFSL